MSEKFNQNDYIAAYNKENYSRIELKVSKETKARWELQAKTEGISLTALIKKKMEEK